MIHDGSLYKPSKPTGAQLFKRFMLGYSMAALGDWQSDTTVKAESTIRAYLRSRDKRRKAK